MKRLALTVAAVLCLPASAPAELARPATETLPLYLPTAQAKWPGSSCAGRETLLIRPRTDPLLRGSNGAAYLLECKAVIASDLVGARFCETLTHELGHLAGYGHAAEPRSIMYVQVDASAPPRRSYRPCVEAARRVEVFPAEALAADALDSIRPMGGGRVSCARPRRDRFPVWVRCVVRRPDGARWWAVWLSSGRLDNTASFRPLSRKPRVAGPERVQACLQCTKDRRVVRRR